MDALPARFVKFRRPSLRLHLTTWLLLVVPASALALANIPGEYRLDWHTREAIGCEHGWPCVWLLRQRLDGQPEDLWALTREVCYFDAIGLTTDVLTALGVLAALAAAIEWRRRRRHRICQFTLADWLIGVAIIGWGLAHVADRREKIAAVCRAAQLSVDDINDVEINVPTWLRELLPNSEHVYGFAWWLGWMNFGGDFDLPRDETELSMLPPLLDQWPEQTSITVCRECPNDKGVPIAFDPSALRSLAKLRRLTLERADEPVLACLDSLSELRSLEFDEECEPLSETAATHLNGLTNLRFLSASRKCLGDAGMAAVAKLTALETLSLAGISDADLAMLGALKNLRYLALPDSTISDSGVARLAAHKRIEVIEVSGGTFTGAGLSPLAWLPRLRTLDLSGSGLNDEGLANIGGISSLRELNLRDTPIAGLGLAHLGTLSWLRRLDLSRTDIDDQGLACLPKLPALEELDLACTRVTEHSLSAVYRAPKLNELSLCYTRVASFCDFDLHQLPRLTMLMFGGSRAGREEMATLLATRPEIEFRRGRSCGLHPPGFAWQLAQAREHAAKGATPIVLAVERTEVGDRELASLCGLQRLDTLCLQFTRITDHGLPVLLHFDELTTLDLTGAAVSDAGLAYLAKLPRLTALNLSYTDVTAASVVRLAEFPALRVVCLDPSQITDEVVSEMKGMANLKCLAIDADLRRWGKRYRAARTFEAFLGQLRIDLPEIDVSGKDPEFWSGANRG